MRYGGVIDQIQITTVTATGNEIGYGARGGYGGVPELIEFAEGERLIGVTGFYSAIEVEQLTFISITDEGTIHVYGPYGVGVSGTTETFFSVFGKIDGIFGKYDNSRLRGIGFYYEGEGMQATRT